MDRSHEGKTVEWKEERRRGQRISPRKMLRIFGRKNRKPETDLTQGTQVFPKRHRRT